MNIWRDLKGEIWIEGRSIVINHDYSLIIQPRSIRIKRREMRIFLERLEAKRICQALTVTLLYLSRAPSALRNPFLSSPFLAKLFLFSNFPRVLNTCILEMENISLLYISHRMHTFETKNGIRSLTFMWYELSLVRGRLLKALKSRRREKIPFAPQLCLQQKRANVSSI